MNNNRKQLYVPKDYGLRLILFPLMAGIILVNILIVGAFGVMGAGLLATISAKTLYLIAGVEILLMVAYVVFATLGAHHLAGPMRGLEVVMGRLGSGDLTARLRFRKNDFHANIPNVFNDNVERLRESVNGIKDTAGQIEGNLGDNEKVTALVSELREKLDRIKTEDDGSAAAETNTAPAAGKKKQAGFSLIELLSVLTIVSILSVIALPAYFSYTIRARVSEGISVIGDTRATVTQNIYSGVDDICAGVNLNPAGAHVVNVDCNAGVLTVTMSEEAGDTILTFTPEHTGGNVQWICAGVPIEYAPSECRQ